MPAINLPTKKSLIEWNAAHTDGRGRILKPSALDNALESPNLKILGHETNPSWPEKISKFIQELGQGHAFEGGNKRTAGEGVRAIYELNGGASITPDAATRERWVNSIVDGQADGIVVTLTEMNAAIPDGQGGPCAPNEVAEHFTIDAGEDQSDDD